MNSQQAINLLNGLEQRLDDYCELNNEGKAAFRMAITALELFGNAEQLPSAQPDIKQAAKLLSDFIESCPGGDSYLITPDGEELRTDWGYALEGIQLIHYWAERRQDDTDRH